MISKKIAMLGMWGVGKTSLVQQFVNSIYDDKYLSTLGVKVDKKVININDTDVNLMLWDIAGVEGNFSVPLHYVKGSAGYLLVLDGTRRESLACGLDIIAMVEKGLGPTPFVAVVNKSDLDWEITEAELDEALAPFNCIWLKSSAKTGENVELAFNTLTEKVL